MAMTHLTPVDDGTTDPLELIDEDVEGEGLAELASEVDPDSADAPLDAPVGEAGLDLDLEKELAKVAVPVEEADSSAEPTPGKKPSGGGGYSEENINREIDPSEFWKEGVHF
jgi:hypothetical protein